MIKELLIFILLVFLWAFMGLVQEAYFPIEDRAYLMAYGGVLTIAILTFGDWLRG